MSSADVNPTLIPTLVQRRSPTSETNVGLTLDTMSDFGRWILKKKFKNS